MSNVSKKRFVKSKDNEWETPFEVWKSISHLLPKGKIIWEPFYLNGNSGSHFKKLGFQVIHEDEDFFRNNKGDIIVSNPPFSIKKEILTRLKALNKPFMLLMPSETLSTRYIRDLFGNELQIVIPNGRINFIKNGIQTDKCTFPTFFYCWKMNFTKDILWL